MGSQQWPFHSLVWTSYFVCSTIVPSINLVYLFIFLIIFSLEAILMRYTKKRISYSLYKGIISMRNNYSFYSYPILRVNHHIICFIFLKDIWHNYIRKNDDVSFLSQFMCWPEPFGLEQEGTLLWAVKNIETGHEKSTGP